MQRGLGEVGTHILTHGARRIFVECNEDKGPIHPPTHPFVPGAMSDGQESTTATTPSSSELRDRLHAQLGGEVEIDEALLFGEEEEEVSASSTSTKKGKRPSSGGKRKKKK